MRFLALFGSPRSDGNTACLLDAFKARYGNASTYTRVDAYTLNPHPCINCGWCEENDGCHFHDMDTLYDMIDSSEVIVIASPIFHGSFPSPLKAVFDRFQPYYHKLRKRKLPPTKKKGVLLLTGGSENPRYGEMVIPQANLIFQTLGGTLTNSCFALGCDNKQLTTENASKLIQELIC